MISQLKFIFTFFSDEYDEDSGLLPSVTMKIYKGDPEDKQVSTSSIYKNINLDNLLVPELLLAVLAPENLWLIQ